MVAHDVLDDARYAHASPSEDLYNVTEVDAIKMINDIDKRRRTNYNFYTEQKWGMAENYTMSLNSSVLGYDLCQKIIIDCAKL